MRNEEIEGRLQSLEVSMQAILIRLKDIEGELRPKTVAVVAEPPPEAPLVTESRPEVAGAIPPIASTLADLPIAPWREVVTSTRMPNYMRENIEAEQAASASTAPPPSAPSQPIFSQPRPQITIPPTPTADDIEYKFGINGLLRGGAVVVVLAILFGVAIMIGRGALTPPVQFAGEIATCLAFIGIGLKKRNEREDFGQLMVGIGSFGLYASFAAGYAYKHLYEGEPLVAMYMLLSLANLGFAQWRSSKSFLTIGLLGGLVAAMMPMHKDNVLLDFALHFLILVPCAAIIVRNKWNGMAGLMWAVSTAALIPATTSHFEQAYRVGATYLNCAIALFACGKVFKPSEFDKHAAIQTVMLVLTGFFAIGIDTGHKGSLHALVLAVVAGAVGYALRENEKARNATWLGGLIVFAIMTPMGYTQNVAAFWYGAEALALVFAAIHFRLVALWAVGFSTFLFSLVAYLYFPDKNILSLARFSPPLELLLLAMLSTTVALNIRYALPNGQKWVPDVATLGGGMCLVAFFVRVSNVVLGNGNTSLHVGAINTLALAIASVTVLVVANRYQRLATFVLGAGTAVTSYLFYMVASPDGTLSFISVPQWLDLCLLGLFSVSVVLGIRIALKRDERSAQEVILFVGGSLLLAFFIRAMNIVLGNGHTTLNISDINSMGIGLAGLATTLVAVTTKRKGLLILSAIVACWLGTIALVQDPEMSPHWLSPILVLLASACFVVGSVSISETQDKSYQEPVMVFAGLALSAFFVRLMNLVGINHLLDLTKDASTYCSLGMLNAIWTVFALRNRRPANIILAWFSFVYGVCAGAALPAGSGPPWLSPFLLATPLVSLGVLYAVTPRKGSDEISVTAICVIPGWYLSTVFLRQELMRPWIGLNQVASYTAAWVIFAVFLITAGFKADRRFLRYWALVLFAITVGKVFMVDLSALDSVIRFAMLTLLGAGMMGGGYWYLLWRRSHGPKSDLGRDEENLD